MPCLISSTQCKDATHAEGMCACSRVFGFMFLHACYIALHM